MVDSVWFGMVGWIGLFYEEDIKKPLVPLKVAKANLELHLETIPVRVGPIVILRLTQSSWAGAGTELCKNHLYLLRTEIHTQILNTKSFSSNFKRRICKQNGISQIED